MFFSAIAARDFRGSPKRPDNHLRFVGHALSFTGSEVNPQEEDGRLGLRRSLSRIGEIMTARVGSYSGICRFGVRTGRLGGAVEA